MNDIDLPRNASLDEVLGARALRTPRARLLIDVAGGALIVVAAAWARPGGWMALGTLGLCLASYGVWALTERTLAEPSDRTLEGARGVRVARAVAASVGLASFVLFLFAALAVALGRFIS